MVQVQSFWIGTSYGLGILHQCGKMFKTKNQKVFGTNFYVGGLFCSPLYYQQGLSRNKNKANICKRHFSPKPWLEKHYFEVILKEDQFFQRFTTPS